MVRLYEPRLSILPSMRMWTGLPALSLPSASKCTVQALGSRVATLNGIPFGPGFTVPSISLEFHFMYNMTGFRWLEFGPQLPCQEPVKGCPSCAIAEKTKKSAASPTARTSVLRIHPPEPLKASFRLSFRLRDCQPQLVGVADQLH